MKLDRYDLNILSILQRDGRVTKSALARAIGLSTTPCWERLKKLESGGIIRGYRTDIDVKRVVHVEFFIVEITLKRHEAADFEKFEQAIHRMPEVIACDGVGGGVDYIIKVVARDIDHYQALIDDMLDAGLGIARYFTYAVTKPVKQAVEMPLTELLNAEPPA